MEGQRAEVSGDLLFEIGVEEVPAGYVRPALAQGAELLARRLAEAGLAHGEVRIAATPRRLAWHVTGIADRAPDREEEVTGPPERAAFKDGQPTPAATGFAAKLGVAVGALAVRETPKGRYLAAVRRTPGVRAADALGTILPDLVRGLRFPKSMHWRGRELLFCRPIRYLACLLGDQVVPVAVGHLAAGRTTRGHPFLAPGEIPLADASWERYLDALRRASVVASLEERHAVIRGLVEARAGKADPELLEEVTHLVELPSVLEGGYDARYLALPECVLVEVMARHQRYFPVHGANGGLQPRFLAVMNRPASHADQVRAGNERVLAARLADAEFFWTEDRKRPLSALRERLAGVVFHHRLGSLKDKSLRLEQLAPEVARLAGFSERAAERAARAGALAKCDLVSDLVVELPALQGQMGAIYARASGEADEVARAIEDHYRPRNPADRVPEAEPSVALALAEKLDHLVGLFAAGEEPTGSSDPFALRRQALGLLRLLVERKLDLPLERALARAAALYPAALSASQAVPAVLAFLRERLRQSWIEGGAPYDLVEAVLAVRPEEVADARARLDALVGLAREPWWKQLADTVERTFNIHKKEADLPDEVDPARFAEELERRLWARLGERRAGLEAHLAGRSWDGFARAYQDAFSALVHEFFATVYVNVPDVAVRRNRLALLKEIGELFRANFADLAVLAATRR